MLMSKYYFLLVINFCLFFPSFYIYFIFILFYFMFCLISIFCVLGKTSHSPKRQTKGNNMQEETEESMKKVNGPKKVEGEGVGMG